MNSEDDGRRHAAVCGVVGSEGRRVHAEHNACAYNGVDGINVSRVNLIRVREAAGLDIAEVVMGNVLHVAVHKGGHLSTADVLIRTEGIVALTAYHLILNAPCDGSHTVFCYRICVVKLKRGVLYLG